MSVDLSRFFVDNVGLKKDPFISKISHYQYTPTSAGNLAITPVDLNNSIVLMKAYLKADTQYSFDFYSAGCYLSANNQVTIFSSLSTYLYSPQRITVIEFNPAMIKSLQRGNHTVAGTSGLVDPTTITINAVNKDKCLVFVNAWRSNDKFIMSYEARLKSNTELDIYHWAPSQGTGIIPYQIVEFY